MKKLMIIAVIGLSSLATFAQKVIEKNFKYSGQSIDLNVKFASEIEVKTWDKSTVYFKADITTKNGKFINLYNLDIDENGSTLDIEEDAIPVFKAFQDEWDKNHPGSKHRGFMEDDTYEFNYVLYVPKGAQFKVSSINGHLKSDIIEGDFTAELINGDIDIKKYNGDMDLQTINGAIDLVMKNAEFVAKTLNGSIYADEKLNLKAENQMVGRKVMGSLEGGKNRLVLNTINGNLYLRL